jgi:hypothetical protein
MKEEVRHGELNRPAFESVAEKEPKRFVNHDYFPSARPVRQESDTDCPPQARGAAACAKRLRPLIEG